MQPFPTPAPPGEPARSTASPRAAGLGLRPYAALPKWLLIALLALWVGVFWNQTCHTGPYYFELCVIVCMVCLALAANHWRLAQGARSGAVSLWVNVLLRSAYDLATFVVLLLVVLLPFAVAMPAVSCMTDRSRASEVLVGASPLKETIKERALAAGTLAHSGHDLKVARSGPLAGGLVTEDGVIVVASEKPALVMFFHPALVDGAVRWTCTGYPREIMPAPCREKS